MKVEEIAEAIAKLADSRHERDVRFVPKADIRATPSAPGQGESRVWLSQEVEAVLFKDRLRCLRTQE